MFAFWTVFVALIAGCSGSTGDGESGRSGARQGDAGAAHVVTVERTEGGWELRRDGEAYFIRGAGGGRGLDLLAEAGANSVRTWDAEGIGALLDEAHGLGLTVAVGIWVEHERHGFDWDDPEQQKRMLDKTRRLVLEHKDHPAVLLWGVGNEVSTGTENVGKALRAIEACAALVQELDPDHPVMTVTPEIGTDLAVRVQRECPSVDILGINSYAGLATIPERLSQQGYDGPYIIGEFGPPGHWECGRTEWGEPIELTSTEKAAFYEDNYRRGVLADVPGRCLGSYVFLWGDKQEVTGTWFGMFLYSGEALAMVDTMTRLWTGNAPDERAPEVYDMTLDLDGMRARAGQEFRASVRVRDADGDDLDLQWKLRPESTDRRHGGDKEDAPDLLDDAVIETRGTTAVVRAPDGPGGYRMYVYVRDGTGKAATANVPFLVE